MDKQHSTGNLRISLAEKKMNQTDQGICTKAYPDHGFCSTPKEVIKPNDVEAVEVMRLCYYIIMSLVLHCGTPGSYGYMMSCASLVEIELAYIAPAQSKFSMFCGWFDHQIMVTSPFDG